MSYQSAYEVLGILDCSESRWSFAKRKHVIATLSYPRVSVDDIAVWTKHKRCYTASRDITVVRGFMTT